MFLISYCSRKSKASEWYYRTSHRARCVADGFEVVPLLRAAVEEERQRPSPVAVRVRPPPPLLR